MTKQTTTDESPKKDTPATDEQDTESKGVKPTSEPIPAGKAESKNEPTTTSDGAGAGSVVPATPSGQAMSGAGSVNVEVPGHALEKAIVQLQNLTALREQEAERQQRVIANMEAAMERQGKTNRWLLAVSMLLVAGGLAAILIMMNLRTVNVQVREDVQTLSGTVATTGQMVQESAQQQSRGLAEVSKDVKTATQEQAQMAAKIEDKVTETRQVMQDEAIATQKAVTSEVSKQTVAIAKVEDKVAETQQAMQNEAIATQKAVTSEVSKQTAAIAKVEGKVAETQQAMRDEAIATQKAVTSEVGKQAEAISTVHQAVATTHAVQSEGLAEIRREVEASRNEQSTELEKVHNEVLEARVQSTNLSKSVDAKIDQTEATISDKVDQSIAALKAERDRVQAEVKQLLEERMELLTEREIELHGVEEKLKVEEAEVSEMAAKAREETRSIVTDALKKLAEINGAPSVILGDQSAEQEPTEAPEKDAADTAQAEAATEAQPEQEAAEPAEAEDPAPAEEPAAATEAVSETGSKAGGEGG